MHLDAARLRDLDRALAAEWLLADGAGGYASSTVLGCPTRRYHGLWVPALQPPVGRHVVLSHVDERLVTGEGEVWLSTTEYADGFHPEGWRAAERFDLDGGPRLASRAGGTTVEREVLLLRDGQGVCITYEVQAEGDWTLDLGPMLALRSMHHLGRRHNRFRVEALPDAPGWRVLSEGMPAVFLWTDAADAEARTAPAWYEGVLVRVERERGFDFVQDLLAPGRWTVRGRGPARFHLFCSFDPPRAIDVAAARQAELRRQADVVARAGGPKDERLARLARAADAFLVRRRVGDEDLLTVIAGYPWFSDWGRDTLIALPGLAIETGRLGAARKVLGAFAAAASEGMVPNRFAEETGQAEYNTVDASLWFLQALAAYARTGGDVPFVRDRLWPAACEVVERYAAGTRFGIRADSDGLITAGSPETQLTWMDARTSDGRPVTPRHGKAVEINALWLSGLALVEDLARRLGVAAPGPCAERGRARDAFEELFWNDAAGCLYDVVGPDGRRDAAIRPNQVLAVGLPHAPLTGRRAKSVVRTVCAKLMTPRGLRTLAPADPAYTGRYAGGPDERDAAYHQGTVWPWLVGPYVDAVFAVEQRECARGEATQILEGLLDSMEEAGLGFVSEVFDGDPPHRPGGCIAQAWSVAAAVHVWKMLEATGGVP
ncbi:MAG TPA: amylo-alpha-1,6-glucosidase [Phycisphaerae bacterium]|nr:amylo-alpha-1,6-glucosidase [Phycisphaerae bacterium]